MLKHLPALFTVAIFCCSGCKHKIPDPVQPAPKDTTTTPVPQPPAVNPKDSVCFAEEVLPLLISNCAKSGCHNETDAAQGVVLSSHARLKSSVSGNLLVQVIQDPSPLGMPPAPHQKLNAAQISLIQKWVGEGMKEGVDCQGPCDTANVTFNASVLPILTANCIGCHQNTVPIFTGYNGIKSLAVDGRLLCAINHGSGCLPMPQGGQKLSPCKIRTIAKWVEAGSPDN